MEGLPANQRTSRTEGLAQTCRAVLHVARVIEV